MNISTIIQKISDRSINSIPKKQIKSILNSFRSLVYEGLKTEGRVVWSNFLSIAIKPANDRTVIHPVTKKKIKCSTTKIKIKLDKKGLYEKEKKF